MQRASHALEADGEVWVVDPVDAVGIDELFAEFGDVAGVVLLLDRHARRRRNREPPRGLGPRPRWMSGVAEEVDAPVEPLHARAGDTEYGVHQVVDLPFWQEAALYGEETGTLVVPEALGTGRLLPQRHRAPRRPPDASAVPAEETRSALARADPRRARRGVLDDATDALVDALGGSRSRAPSLYAKTAREFLPV